MTYHFGCRKHHRFFFCSITTHRYFGAIKERFDKRFIAFHQCHTKSGGQLVGILHLRNAKTRAVGSRFNKAGHTYFCLNMLFVDVTFFSATHQNTFSDVYAKATEIVV